MKKIVFVLSIVNTSVALAGVPTDELEQQRFRSHAQEVFQYNPVQLELGETIHTNYLYTVYPHAQRKVGSYTTLYVGKRQKTVSIPAFVKGMRQHISDVAVSFRKYGLNGYDFFLTGEYEMAIQNWDSKEASLRAFSSAEAGPVIEAGGKILELVIFEELK